MSNLQTREWTVKAQTGDASGFYRYAVAGSGQWELKMLSEEFLRSGHLETFLERKTTI